VGDKAREASSLLSGQSAYFGREGEDQSRGDRTKTGYGAQDLAFARGLLILGDVLGNFGIQLQNLSLDEGKTSPGLALQNGVALNMATVAQTGALLDQSRASNLQASEFKYLIRDRLIRYQGERSSHAGQGARG